MQPKPFTPPIISTLMQERTALHKEMRQLITQGKHLAFCAPGGYGKTVTVGQYLSKRRIASWVTLSGADNEPDVFYQHVGEALVALGSTSPLPTTYDLESLITAARNIPTKGGRHFLVFDDGHHLVRHDLLHALTRIINALPSSATAMLLGRSVLPAEFQELNRSYSLFDAEKLAFSLDEAIWFYERDEADLPNEDVKILWERTQGWAMGLYALSFESGAEPTEPTADNRDLGSFLEDGVWHHWDTETQTFLLQCSVAPYLTKEIAALLSGNDDADKKLESLYRSGAFLSKSNGGIYRFHDLFLDWLQEKALEVLGEEDLQALYDKAAQWLFDREEYFRAAQLYIKNADHEGISRCMAASNRFGGNAENLSVESKVDFVNTYVSGLTADFIEENPYLVSKCANVAFLNGNAEDFCRYADALTAYLPMLAKEHPDLVQTAGFIGSLDFRVPLRSYAKRLKAQMANMPQAFVQRKEAMSSTMTQNLPLLHRSMRDFSEYADFDEEEMLLLRNTFGVMIGADYPVMESCYLAGLRYERSELREANYHALEAVRGLSENSRAETVFCAHMILALVYDALGATDEASKVFAEMKEYTEQPEARFLNANVQALSIARDIEQGNEVEYAMWLASQGPLDAPLALYRLPRHFTTLRVLVAQKEYEKAIDLGERIITLAHDYVRPLDAIEAGVITVRAQVLSGNTDAAKLQLQKALTEALPYGYTQQFVNEGKTLAPLLSSLPNNKMSEEEIAFAKVVLEKIGEVLGSNSTEQEVTQLPPQQLAVLERLAKDMSYAEIGEELGIGRGTVKTHVLQVYKALGVHTAKEAVAKAHTLKIL